MSLYETYEKQIISEFEKHGNIGEYQALQEKMKEYLQAYNINDLRDLILNELRDYDFEFMKHLYKKGMKTISCSNETFDSIKPKDRERLMMEIMAHKNEPVIKVSNTYHFRHIKEIIKDLYEEYSVKAFVISKSHSLDGRVNFKKFDAPKRIPLVMEHVNYATEKKYLSFIGDPSTKKVPENQTSLKLYFHEFECDGEKYDLLSEKPIKPQDCIVEGMVINMTNDLKLGESMRLNETRKVILSHTIKLSQKDLSLDEVRELSKDWTRESLSKDMFGLYRHPKIFESFILAYLFGGKNDDYPTHLIFKGPNGSGKTKLLESLSIQIPNQKPGRFIDGANSTVKGLMPSFSTSKTDPGLFVKASRICYVDEFFKVLGRVGFNNGQKNSQGLESFTTMLEHKPALVASGNTEPTEYLASAKAMFVTNPERNLIDLPEIISVIGEPTMARFMFYEQTQEHVDFVETHIPDVMNVKKEDALPKRNPNIVNIFDYFYNTEVVVPYDKLVVIRNDLKTLIADELQGMFRNRYYHHIACIIDGVSNTRWLCNEKSSLEYDDKDFEEAHAILHYIISSWRGNFDLMKLDVKKRVSFLSVEETDLFELVCKENGDLNRLDIKDKESLKQLLKLEIVFDVGGLILSYFNPDIWKHDGVHIKL